MNKIVLEDFNEGNGYYKINLAYLNKEQVEEIEALVSKWKPTDEDIKDCIQMCLTDANEQRFKDYGTNLKNCLAWLEKQDNKEYVLKSSKDEDICKLVQYIEKQAKAYELNLPNRSYDIYGFAKDILVWLEKQVPKSQGKELEDSYITPNKEFFQFIYDRLRYVHKENPNTDYMLSLKERISNMYYLEQSKSTFKASDWYVSKVDGKIHDMTYTPKNKDEQAKWTEEDDKILKEIISDVKFEGYNSCILNNSYKKMNWLKSLKQRMKQVHVDEYQHEIKMCKENDDSITSTKKFKIGDWIVCGQFITQILEIVNDGYVNSHRGFISFHDAENYHLWTIDDAKEGDVLAFVTDEEDLWIMIYWSLYEPYEGHVHYHALLVNDNFSGKGTCCIYINDLKPATKEQSELLFQKMKEAGYEWNCEKKELKQIKI